MPERIRTRSPSKFQGNLNMFSMKFKISKKHKNLTQIDAGDRFYVILKYDGRFARTRRPLEAA